MINGRCTTNKTNKLFEVLSIGLMTKFQHLINYSIKTNLSVFTIKIFRNSLLKFRRPLMMFLKTVLEENNPKNVRSKPELLMSSVIFVVNVRSYYDTRYFNSLRY